MGDYEEEQMPLMVLLQEILSDEENSDKDVSLFRDIYVSDCYNIDNSSESDEEHVVQESKKRKVLSAAGTSTETLKTNLLQTIEETIGNFTVEYDSDNSDNVPNEIIWGSATGENLKNNVKFNASNIGLCANIREEYFNGTPYKFYKLLVNDNILGMIVEETNRYAVQCLEGSVTSGTRIKFWKPTTISEIEKFIGILMWMGLCQLPSIQSYWSKKVIYENKLKNVMSGNRFQLLLKMLHFSNNNDEKLDTDRLRLITPFLDKLKQSFQSVIVPGEYVCIGDTLVPFQGRLKLEQPISNKRSKYGIKLFKLCIEGGYTYNFEVYCGKERDENSSVPSKVVITLMDGLLHEGRTLCTDDYYTSVSLAQKLLKNETHLIGTLRCNRKLNPERITQIKLKKGESVAEESNSGVVVQKWKDKKDVLMLSTRYTNAMVKIQKRNIEIEKPRNVLEYNKCKSYVDISNQLKSNNTLLGLGVTWYRKLFIELLLGTAVVNAYYLHKTVAKATMSITTFKELILQEIFSEIFETNKEDRQLEKELTKHRLEDKGRKGKRRCVRCYSKLKTESGRTHAMSHTPRSNLMCVQCEKCYCLGCFFDEHKYTT